MKYLIGDIIKCKVIGIQDYGVFVEIKNDFNGLIHISEISEKYVNNITDYLTINEIIYARILEIDYKNKRMKLSIKNINYRGKVNRGKIHETPNGFSVLKKCMPQFINNKLKEYVLKEKA